MYQISTIFKLKKFYLYKIRYNIIATNYFLNHEIKRVLFLGLHNSIVYSFHMIQMFDIKLSKFRCLDNCLMAQSSFFCFLFFVFPPINLLYYFNIIKGFLRLLDNPISVLLMLNACNSILFYSYFHDFASESLVNVTWLVLDFNKVFWWTFSGEGIQAT